MRVLYVEPDPHVRQTVKRGFEAGGAELVALGEARQALSFLNSTTVDAVICAVEPGGSEGATFLSGAQARLGNTPLVLVSAFYTPDDPELAPLFMFCQSVAFVAKPFGLSELGKALRGVMRPAAGAPPVGPSTLHGIAPPPAPRPGPGGPSTLHGAPSTLHGTSPMAPRPAPMGPTTLHGTPTTLPGAARRTADLRNLNLLTRLWASKSTGTLKVGRTPAGQEGWASLSRGGPADPESMKLVGAALQGGELHFEPGEVDAPGDWDGMMDLLWRAARDPTARSFVLENRFQGLSKTQWSGLLLSLPLAAPTRRLLASLNPQSTLGEAIARSGVDGEVVSPDLAALVRLRVIALGTPSTAEAGARPGDPAAPRRPDPVSIPPSGGGGGPRGHSGVASLSVARPASMSSVAASTPTATGLSRLRRPEPGTVTSVTPASTQRPRASADGVRGAPTSTGSGATSAAANARARDRINSVLRYLRGEINNLGSAPPAVLLGVPADASNELVAEAAKRLRERYQGMVTDPGLDDEAHKLAAQMLERVEDAVKNFGKARSAAAAGAMDEERLLALAHELIQQRQWEQAEKVLIKARQLKPDHIGVISNLGWARLHNPARPAAERAKGAQELLELAEQFDPQHAEGQYYLAELLYRLGEYAKALPRAERAARAAPENPAAASLARKLRNRLNPSVS